MSEAQVEALQTTKVQWEEELQVTKKKAIEPFCTSMEYNEVLVEFIVESYLQGMADYQAKVQDLFLRLALDRLDTNEGDEEETTAKEAMGIAQVGASKEGTLAEDVLVITKIASAPIKIVDDPTSEVDLQASFYFSFVSKLDFDRGYFCGRMS